MNTKDQAEMERVYQAKAVQQSKNCIDPIIGAAITIDSIHCGQLDMVTVTKSLLESSSRVLDGNTREIEMMLMAQAQTLNALFHRTLSQIGDMDMLNQIQIFSEIALKAQDQSRKTLAVLAELKHPRRTTFIKQQNNAINQQVNNSSKIDDSEKSEKFANELLKENAHEALELRRANETVSVNSTLETVEAIDRSKVTGRERG